MTAFVILAASLLAGPEIWTESSLAHVFPDTPPPETAQTTIRLHVTRGERASFQIAIHGLGEALDLTEAYGQGEDEAIGLPEIRRVGYLSVPNRSIRGLDDRPLWPDPLLEFAPFRVPAGETHALWITYDTPRNARPGTHRDRITLHQRDGCSHEIPVTIHISQFTMPRLPLLRSALELDRGAIRRFYALDDGSPKDWRPIYDTFARERLSFSLWDGGDLVRVGTDGAVDAALLKRHLAYAGRAMSTIILDPGATGINAFPRPTGNAQPDPLSVYLRDMGEWLADRRWLERAVFEPMPLAQRGDWPALHRAFTQVRAANSFIERLLVGDIHPFFENDATIWAVPFMRYDPHALVRLRHGDSLATPLTHPARQVTASSNSRLPQPGTSQTRPTDAYDGCLFSYWLSAPYAAGRAEPWLQIEFEAPVTTDTLRVVWRSGFEASRIDVTTSLRGSRPAPIRVTWTPNPPPYPHAHSWADGRLDRPHTFSTIRFEFAPLNPSGLVGVTEVLIGAQPQAAPPARIAPTQPWMFAEAAIFPSLAVDAHPVEARLLPWVCYAHQLAGFMHRGLDHWPDGWKSQAATQPLVWEGGGHGQGFLFYPGRHRPLPSIRAARLRDGIEDYEILTALSAARARGAKMPDDLARALALNLYAPDPPPGDLDAYRRMIEKMEPRFGWALDQYPTENSP